ncbi:MAG: RbsD/FucU domain-containing protein [Burkholderiaceae bacterium]|nr:RbsD/FucU domain-containing protein [Burkholderiaceae bacterium]
MLLHIDPILTPQLLFALADMGHGDCVAVVDANFTSASLAGNRPVIRLPGLPLLRVCQAVLSVFPLDASVKAPISYMQVSDKPGGHRDAVQQEVYDDLLARGIQPEQIEAVERFAFYERVRQCRVIVQSGDLRAYGNYIFSKGVILG